MPVQLYPLSYYLPPALLPSATRTATVFAEAYAEIPSALGCVGAHFVINVTSLHGGTPSIVPHVQGYDAGSGTFFDLLIGPAISAAGFTVLRIHPMLPGAPNLVAQDILPTRFGVLVVHADGQPIDYSVGYNPLLGDTDRDLAPRRTGA